MPCVRIHANLQEPFLGHFCLKKSVLRSVLYVVIQLFIFFNLHTAAILLQAVRTGKSIK